MIATLLLAACVPFTVPAVLSSPGTYCLESHQTYPGTNGAAVTVTADFVTVDLGGLSIVGTGGSSATSTGVYAAGRRGLTVQNGTLSGFLFGAYINSGSVAATVRDVIFVDNWYIGAWVDGPGAAIIGCRVVNTGGALLPGYTRPLAIKAGGLGLRVVGNTVAGMILPAGGEVVGLAIDQAPGATIADNTFSLATPTPDGYAVWINGGTTRAVLAGNNITNFGYGIVFAPPALGKYREQTLVDVATPYAGGTDAGGNH